MMKNNFTVSHVKAGYVKQLYLVFLLSTIAFGNNVFSQQPVSFTSQPTQKGPFANVNEENTLDAAPPVITYSPLTSTCTTGNRTLTATITDADGVPTSGAGLPRLYWQINSGAFSVAIGAFVSGNTYTFTFGNGALPGNLVSYYIVAQDNVGNVIAKPSAGAGGYTTSPPAASIDPTSPDFYVIQTTLATGTYTVGAGQNYNTITDAINAYNNSCLNGAITFVLTDASYDASEVYPIIIGNPQASATNTLTIKPNTGVNVTVQGSSSDALIKFNGSDYVTIDGSNNGSSTRNLTFINNSTNLNSTILWVGSASASNGATFNTVKNCIIQGNAGTTTFAGITQGSGVLIGNPAETANTNNTYQNNSINSSYNGIVMVGPTAAGESNNVISNNIVGSTLTAKKLGYRGIYVANQTNIQVFANTVAGINSTAGIGTDVEPTGGIIIAGIISGGSAYGNFVNDVKNTSAGGWPAYGISLQSTSANANFKLYNNFIHSILGYGNATLPGQNGIGIALINGGGYGIYFNSVNLFTAQTNASAPSTAIFIGAGITGTASVDIRNNIFSCRRTAGINYAIYCSVPNIIFSNINYNDYYVLNSTKYVGFLGSNRTTLANWQAATGLDGNSVSVDPIYISTTDLHLNVISTLNDQGSPIAGITTDIDGAARSATVPDIGADEFTPPVCSGNTGGTAIADFNTVCSSGTVNLSASGFSYGLGIAYQWEWSTTSAVAGFSNIPGETNPTSLNTPTISVTTWIRLRVTCSAGAPGYSNVIQITVYNPAITGTTPGTRCGPGTVNLGATGSAGTTVQWYTTPTGGIPLGTGTTFTTPSISSTTPYYAEAAFLGSNGTVGLHDPSLATGISTQLTSWQVYFNVIQATKLLTIDVYPLAIGENSTIDVYNSSNVVIASVTYTTLVGGGATAQTINMGGIPLPVGNGYYLYATNGIPPTGLTRNLSGAVYPYNSSDIIITGNEFNQNFYMCYYNWRFSNGCFSPRTTVNATIGVSATLNVTATPAAICAGQSSNLSVSSSNTSYTYTWTPGPLNGANQTVSPTTTTTYDVSATDGTCTGTGSVTVTVNPASSDVVISPASLTKCSGSAPILLTATGGDIVGIPILTENFNAGTNNWTTGTTGSTGSVAACAWTLRPDGYSASSMTIHSNDNSQFYLSHSDANTGFTKTTLTSPAFSLIGYTSVNFNFRHTYQYFGSTSDSANVEVSTNGSTWVILATYKGTKGSPINFANVNIPLNTYIGQATVYVRFRYSARDDLFWAIDNVNITGDNSGAPITWSPITGLFTNAAGTNAYTGTATSTIYANPAGTTMYTATATPVNACEKSQTISIIIDTAKADLTTSPATSAVSPICANAAVTVSLALSGTGPWSFTYTDGVTPVTVNNVNTSPYTFVVYPSATVTYSVTALNDAICTATAGQLATMNVTIHVGASTGSTWLGITSDWNNLSNWCGGIPTSTRNVLIPVTANAPVITGTTGQSKDIIIASGASLTIASGASLEMTGDMTNDGTLTNDGSIKLNGTTAQTFPGGSGGTVTPMNILEVDNGAGVTVNKKITIKNALLPTAGNITLTDTIRLFSDASTTARVGQLGATAGFTYNGIGKFSIERYISSGTKVGWRFLAAPVTAAGGQTINQAWQEGQAAGSYSGNGYGMQIVGPASAGPGFDQATTTPSLKKYNAVNNTWVSVPGTLGPIATTEGYMAFIRGDRNSNTFGSQGPTNLRTAGAINTGVVGPISTATANTFISLGNPYPSAIDFTLTTRNGLINTYYLWDPQLGVYGGYQSFSSPTYNAVPGGGSYSGGNKFIESGQAFFVYSTGAAPHDIKFTEGCKVSSTYQVQRVAGTEKQLLTRLYAVSDTDIKLTDGNLLEFDNLYSNGMDENDAPKLTNFGENIGILSNGNLFAIERRKEVINTDTVFFQLSQLKQQGYQLEFTPQHLEGLSAWLEDTYLHTTTALNTATVSVIDFTVTADPASKAADRFRIVFRLLSPVPVTFTNIAAFRSGKSVIVKWKVENELNIDHYEVERSEEGRSFTKIGQEMAQGNNGTTMEYQLTDQSPFAGSNFYRIRSVGANNETMYSEVVKVNMDGDASLIVVFPNPVKDRNVGISLTNQPGGLYAVKLWGANGQLVTEKQFIHMEGSERVKLPVGYLISKGIYTLEVVLPNKEKKQFKVVID